MKSAFHHDARELDRGQTGEPWDQEADASRELEHTHEVPEPRPQAELGEVLGHLRLEAGELVEPAEHEGRGQQTLTRD